MKLSQTLFKDDLTPETATNLPAERRKRRQNRASRVRPTRAGYSALLIIAALSVAFAVLGGQIWSAAQAEAARYDRQE